jgi:hypothetical protein
MKTTRYWESAAIPELYEWFATEAEPSSPAWARVSRQVASTPSIAVLLDTLPPSARQPNLFFGALKFLGGPLDADPACRDLGRAHWPQIERLVTTRFTQTNEVGRCAVIAPGACLAPPADRSHRGRHVGRAGAVPRPVRLSMDARRRHRRHGGTPGEVTIECRVSRHRAAAGLPEIAWRAGIDRNPLDPADHDDAAWLRALVWPGEEAREQRLAAALRTVASAGRAPRGGRHHRGPARRRGGRAARGDPRRRTFRNARVPASRAPATVTSPCSPKLGVHWVSNEGVKVVPAVRDALPAGFTDDPRPCFVLALDGVPLARVGSHGQWLEWL